MIYKGLDDEEASFLTFIAQRQADQKTEMIKREIEEVHSFRVRRFKNSGTNVWSQSLSPPPLSLSPLFPSLSLPLSLFLSLPSFSPSLFPFVSLPPSISLGSTPPPQDAVAKLQDEEGLATIQQSSSSSSQVQSDPLTSSSSSSGSKPKQKSKQLALIAGSIKTKRKRYWVLYNIMQIRLV